MNTEKSINEAANTACFLGSVMHRLSKFQKHLIKQMVDEKLHIIEIMDWTNDFKTTYTVSDVENDYFDIRKGTFKAIEPLLNYEQLCGSIEISRRKYTLKSECLSFLACA